MRAGIPAIMVPSLLTHELTHAWQEANCPEQQELQLTEGMAGWAEYQMLLSQGLHEAAERLRRNPCVTYGEGLRLCLRWESVVGAERLVELVQTAQDFPWWLRPYHAVQSLLGC